MENGSAKRERHNHSIDQGAGIKQASPREVDSPAGQGGGNEKEVLHKKKNKKKHQHSPQALSSQDVDGISIDLDASHRYFPTPEKRVEVEKTDLQDPVGTQVVEPKLAVDDRDDEKEGDEKVRLKEEKRRRKVERRAARQTLDTIKTRNLEDVSEEAEDEEKIVPETPRKKKRKLYIQVNDGDSQLVSTSKAIPQVQIEDNCTENTPKYKKQRKHSQESLLHLHTVSAHKSPSIPHQTNFAQILKGPIRTSERKKEEKKNKRKPKSSTESAKGALLKTVLQGCISNISNGDSTSEEVSKTPSIEEESSTEDATEEALRLESPSPIRPPKSQANEPNLISPCLEKKIGNKTRMETPILPPKSLAQTAKQSPANNLNLARLKKEKEPKTDSEYDDKDGRDMKKPKGSTSKMFKAIKRSEEDESENGEDPFAQAMDAIRKSFSIMQNLFSPAPITSSASKPNKKKEKSDSPVKVERARSTSTIIRLPLALNEGVNMASEDWEAAVGKLRSSAGGDDDSEVQENIAFSSSYISARSAGIKISNTTFQVHNLRNNEGWVVSTSSPAEDSSKDFKLKICTVISGQVQVRLGNDGFGVGKGSVFRVRSGEDCVVRNGEKKVAVVWVVCVE